jgi:hypothetical protein
MTNCGTLQSKIAGLAHPPINPVSCSDREVATTAFELWIDAVGNRAMLVAIAAQLLPCKARSFARQIGKVVTASMRYPSGSMTKAAK